MKRLLLLLSLAATQPCVFHSAMEANTRVDMPQTSDIKISIEQSAIRVTGAQGMLLEVISLTGRHVMTVRVESIAQRIELNIPKGCYIVKVGRVVRKIVV